MEKKFSKKIIEEIIKDNQFSFGNEVLYKLCRENFEHKDTPKILAKIWLIGRAYSASVERQKHPDLNISTDDYYIDYVCKNLKDAEFDRKLKILKDLDRITESNLLQIIETHYYLMDKLTITIGKKSEKNRRSFCSKYLHFHLPHLFFIYDSRAVSAIKEYQKSSIYIKNWSKKVDDKYANFFCKCYELKNRIDEECKTNLTVRELDNILLSYKL